MQGRSKANALRQGADAQSRAAEISGQAWGGAINQIGQSVVGGLQDYQKGQAQQAMQQRQAMLDQRGEEAHGMQMARGVADLEQHDQQQQTAADARDVKRKNETALKIAQGLRDPDPQKRDVVLQQIRDPQVQQAARQILSTRDQQNDAYRKERAQFALRLADPQTGAVDPELVRVLVAMDPYDNALEHFNTSTNGGQDGAQVRRYLEAVASIGEKPQGLMNVPAGGHVYDPQSRTPVYQAPTKPETPPNPTEASLALKAAQGDPARALELMRAPQGPKAPGTFEQQIADALSRGDQPTVDRLTKAAELAAGARSRTQGRPVTSGDANRVKDYDTGLDDVAVVEKLLTPGKTGTFPRIGAWLPNVVSEWTGWGADAKSTQAVIDRVKQVIGKTLEEGVLRKEDELKYEKILPTIKDPASVVATKIAGLKAAIALKKQRQLEALTDAGYDVSKFEQRSSRGATSGDQSTGGVPKVGATFNGGRVTKVTKLP